MTVSMRQGRNAPRIRPSWAPSNRLTKLTACRRPSSPRASSQSDVAGAVRLDVTLMPERYDGPRYIRSPSSPAISTTSANCSSVSHHSRYVSAAIGMAVVMPLSSNWTRA